jgi:PKD repeat protein
MTSLQLTCRSLLIFLRVSSSTLLDTTSAILNVIRKRIINTTKQGKVSAAQTFNLHVNEYSSNVTLLEANQPPKADPGGPYVAGVGEPIQFNASKSNDPDGRIQEYRWSFGDGGNSTGMIASYTYSESDEYTLTLEVIDNNGSKSTATTQVNITTAKDPEVTEPPPEGTRSIPLITGVAIMGISLLYLIKKYSED